MNTNLRKLVKLAAAALFLIALAINVKVTLEDPFVMLSEQAIATGSGTNSGTGGGGSGTGGGGHVYKIKNDSSCTAKKLVNTTTVYDPETGVTFIINEYMDVPGTKRDCTGFNILACIPYSCKPI